jgi:uncharacterized protein YcaQ
VADISSAEARRLALASLGFGGPRSKQAGVAHVRSTANRLGAIQVDSVNVLARAHYLPTFSRHGQYAMSILDDLAHTKRELFEYWGHAACLLPMEIYPLMRWRMENQIENWSGIEAMRRTYIEAVFRRSPSEAQLRPATFRLAERAPGHGGAGRMDARQSSFSFAKGGSLSPDARISSACMICRSA